MRLSFMGRTISTAFTAIAVAIPTGTAALVMLHAVVSDSATPVAFPVSTPPAIVAAVAPPQSQSSRTRVPAIAAPAPQPAAPTSAPLTINTDYFRNTGQRSDGPQGGDDHGHR